jgi:hypothetical protein
MRLTAHANWKVQKAAWDAIRCHSAACFSQNLCNLPVQTVGVDFAFEFRLSPDYSETMDELFAPVFEQLITSTTFLSDRVPGRAEIAECHERFDRDGDAQESGLLARRDGDLLGGTFGASLAKR